jgi:selenide,water dikinase
VILADPQTSGGLLVSVDAEKALEFEKVTASMGIALQSFGKLIKRGNKLIEVK